MNQVYWNMEEILMSMPNDKDHDLSPEEGSEERKYSFLQETIKPRPISREQLGKQFVRIAVYGVILGAFACIGFFALKPWAQNWFRGDLKTVTIPEDEEPSEEMEDGDQETEASDPVVMDAEAYEMMLDSVEEIAAEARKGVVSVEPVSEEEDWAAEMTGIRNGVTGLITADNGQEILILADVSVCEQSSEWDVVFQNDKHYSASLKMKDENSGLAVFSVARGTLDDTTWGSIKVSVLGNSNLVTRGDLVIALGNMFGYADGMSWGVVSSTEYKTTFYDGECDIIATDIPAEWSGTGVLFNMEGEAVGLASSAIWEESGRTLVNAYAVSDLKLIIELLANGEAVPYVGIYGTTVTSELEQQQGMPSGVYVVDVDPDSPAMAAGIQSGDIICQVSGEKISGITAFQRALFAAQPGRTVNIQGQRLGADGYVDVDFTVAVEAKK